MAAPFASEGDQASCTLRGPRVPSDQGRSAGGRRLVLDRDAQAGRHHSLGILGAIGEVDGHHDVPDESGGRGQSHRGTAHRRPRRDPADTVGDRHLGDGQAKTDRIEAAGQHVRRNLDAGSALGDLLIDDGRQRLTGSGDGHRQHGLAVPTVPVDRLDRQCELGTPRHVGPDRHRHDLNHSGLP